MKALISALFISLLFIGCSSPTDEQKIAAALSSMVKALEEKSQSRLIQYLDRDFRAQTKLGTADIRRMMFFYFRQNKNIRVYITQKNIRLYDNRAELVLDVVLTGAEGLLPKLVKAYAVEMLWRKNNDQWRVSRLLWKVKTVLN